MRARVCLLACLALACGRESEQERGGQAQAQEQAELDAGALRASAIEGLEAAADDPALAGRLELSTVFDQPELEPAIARLIARLGGDRRLAEVGDRLFAELQEGPAMRAALVEFARQNPELELAALTEGFVGHVDERLTRPAIAEAIEAELRAELRRADAALASALTREAGGAELLATAIIVCFADAQVRAELERRLGKDPADLQARLSKRLAEPGRVGYLLLRLGERLRGEAGVAAMLSIVDHEASASLVAAALARALDDPGVRSRFEAAFGLALAEPLDERAFAAALRELLGEPAVAREARALLAALAREPFVRAQIGELAAGVVAAPDFAESLLDAID